MSTTLTASEYNEYKRKGISMVIKIAAVIGIITTIAGGFSFYYNSIYRPDVELLVLDAPNGVASLMIRGSVHQVYLNTVVHVLGDWGIQVASSPIMIAGSVQNVFNRIELLKNGVVYGTIPIDPAQQQAVPISS